MPTFTNNDGHEFEVTEADMAIVAPLGQPPLPTKNLTDEQADEQRARWLVESLKHLVKWGLPDDILPRGFWDAWLDEGDWGHDPDIECKVGADECGDPEHMKCLRGYDPDRDDVFVRLTTGVSYESVWDLEVFTRRGGDDDNQDYVAQVAINGEEYTPEQCITDLGALLSVFRLFVQQGRV